MSDIKEATKEFEEKLNSGYFSKDREIIDEELIRLLDSVDLKEQENEHSNLDNSNS